MNNQHQPTNIKHSQGFTLLEVVVAIGITTMIVTVIFGLQNFVIRQQEFTVNSYLTVETANTAMQIMEKEIKNARQGDNGAYIFEENSDQQLTFYSNADRDDDMERIRYFLEGTELKKGVTNPTDYPIIYDTDTEVVTVLNEHIRNGTEPLFYYYNGDWPSDTNNNPLPDGSRLSNTRLIGVHLVVNSNEHAIESDHVLETMIHLRTLKDNL